MYCQNKTLRNLYKLRQRGFGVVLVVMTLTALIGLAITVLSNDTRENMTLIEESRTSSQNHSLRIAEELYRLNPTSTTNSAAMQTLCGIVTVSFSVVDDSPLTYGEECNPSTVLNVGRDGIVQFRSIALNKSGHDVPFGVVDGEQIQLQARAELQHQLRRIASVMENYHYQQSLLHLGGNSTSQENLLSCDYNPDNVLPCVEHILTPIPINTSLFTKSDRLSNLGSTVTYQTDGRVTVISTYDVDGLITLNLDDKEQNVAGVVAATTPWPAQGGGVHTEWVFVRKRSVNE